MGVYYSQYLLPRSGSVSYRPDDTTLEALVHRLVRLQWIDPAWRAVSLVGVDHISKATPRSFTEDIGVFRTLDSPLVIGPFQSPPPEVFWGRDRVRSDGLSRAYDFGESSDGTLEPRYNEELRIIVADVACLVSTNAYTEQEQCGQCAADLVHSVSEVYEDLPERQSWFYAADVHLVLPVPCSRCGAEVDVERLGHLPLFRFALRLDPPSKSKPSMDEGLAEPELLKALREVTGVEFDMIASWS